MSPFTQQNAELAMAVSKATVRAAELKLRLGKLRPSQHAFELHDHRTEVAGDMHDALNRIEPELGDKWMQAMFPEIDLSKADV